MQSEFRMITDIAAVAPKELLFNYDELKEFLAHELEAYRTLIVTEDAIADAKATRAKINKVADSLNSYRISIKKMLMEQYDNDFAPKVNELVAMTKEASDNISKQIKAFEDSEKQAKIDGLHEFFDENVGDMGDFIRFENVLNPRWENKGYAVATAMGEITTAIGRTRADVTAIRDLDSPYAAALLDEYARTHDLGGVIAKNRSLIERDRREAERKAAEEARKAATAQKPVEPPKPAPEPVQPAPIEETTAPTPAPADEPLRSVAFRVWGTRQQLMGLAAYMKANGIAYGKVDE